MESSNAVAIFNKVAGESGKTCLILVKANLLVQSGTPVYVPVAGVLQFAGTNDIANLKKGDSFDIPGGYTLTDIPSFDEKTGKIKVDADGVVIPVTTKDGIPLKTLTY